MLKRFISMLLALVIFGSMLPVVYAEETTEGIQEEMIPHKSHATRLEDYAYTSEQYYDTWYAIVENYGGTLAYQVTSGGWTYTYAAATQDSDILFQLITDNNSSVQRIKTITSMVLSRNSTNLSISFLLYLYSYGNLADSAVASDTIDRNKYTSSTSLYSDGGVLGEISASTASSYFTSGIKLLVSLWDEQLYQDLGFGMCALGFTAYSGKGPKPLCSHSYSNNCDTSCNLCGAVRTVTHSYSANCDTTCNVCGASRSTSVAHTYSGNCDTSCNTCGTTRTTSSSHTYSNSCDTSCNVCGYTRTTTHTYSGNCDTTCNVCSATRTTSYSHTYSNSCDTSCNVCGYTRTITHTYSGNCDTSCNTCGTSRTTSVAHTYSNGADTDCDVCGYVRTFVASGTCGTNLSWSLNNQGVLTISGTGAMTNWTSSGSVSWYSKRSSIKTVVIESGVTSIGSYAFYNCSKLTSVTIPNSVTTIGSCAFYYCTGLTSVTIPGSVTTIGYSAFYKCTGLKEVYFNAINCADIDYDDNVFAEAGSTGIKLVIGAKVTKIPSYMFRYTYVEEWGWAEDSSQAGVTEVIFEKGSVCTSIGAYAFMDCGGLETIIIPSGVTTVGEGAFYDCNSLQEVIFEGDAPFIATNAFYGVSATASHPAGNKTWSADVKQGYGGFLTWDGTESGPTGACGAQGNNLTWTLNGQGTLTISGTGAMQNWTSSGNVPWYNYRTSIKKVVINSGVTSIGAYAFYNYTNLTSVTIPDSVTTIGNYAFSGCSGLTGVYISDLKAWCEIDFGNYSANPLYYAKKLYLNNQLVTDLVIPNSVTAIGNYAFDNCTNLTSVTIPKSVTTIGSYAFSYCTGLTGVYISDLKAWCEIDFGNYSANPLYYAKKLHLNDQLVTDLVIPNSVTAIGNYVFYNCTGLTSVTIPNSVTTIGYSAFDNCTGLTSVTIPNSVTTIGEDAFYNCASLTSVTIPNSVTTIGRSAFYNCTGLTSVTIPNSVTTIGDYAFYKCAGLKEIYYNAINCADKGYYGNVFAEAGSTGIKLVIGAKVTKIPAYMFRYTYAEEWAEDSSRAGVTKVIFEKGSVCTSIGVYAFQDCRGLEEITIPASVKSIGGSAFYNCESLTEITFEGNAPSIGTNAFYGVTADASHPVNDKTWTDSVKQGYGGFITWNGIASGPVGSCGNDLTWMLDNQGTLTISGTGAMQNWTSSGNVPWYNYRTSIKKVVINSGVTSIGAYAFYNYTNLTSVTIPDSVTTIGNYAFSGCSGLTGVYISDMKAWCEINFNSSSSNPLYYAKKLYLNGQFVTKLVIPDSVTTIGSYAFHNCTGLTSVTIPDSVTTIGNDAFSSCSGLKEIYYNAINCADIDYLADVFAEAGSTGIKVVIGKQVTKIPASIFKYTSGGATEWAEDSNRSGVVEVVFEDGSICTSIGAYAFEDCRSLETITIPASVKSIGGSAFYNCESLTEITFEGNAPSIGTNAFYGVTVTACYPCNDSTWTDSVRQNYGGVITWKSSAIASGTCGTNLTWTFEGNGKLTISGTGAMADWTSSTVPWVSHSAAIKQVVIGNGVTTIGKYAFYDCPDLTSVTIGSGVTSIGSYAFYYCSSLTAMSIPKSMKTVGFRAFSSCNSLKTVIYCGTETERNGISMESGNDLLQSATWNYHSYDNSCDTSCDVCGYTRTASHSYSGNCDTTCNSCGATRTTSYAHSYGNSCDTSCDVCGYTRTASHSYSGNCDTTCNSCGATRTTSYSHTYSGNCDTSCNVCGVTRTTSAAHTYSGGADASCDICGATRTFVASGTCGTNLSWSLNDQGVLTISGTGAMTDWTSYSSVPWYSKRDSIKTVVIENGVTTIGRYAFYNYTNLTSVTIPDSVTTIGDCAFYGCDGLTSVTIPDSVTTIDYSAFRYCTSLTSVTIPDSVTTIGIYAFRYCTGLKSVTIGTGVTTIGWEAFCYCTGLKEVYFNAVSCSDMAYDGNAFAMAGSTGIKVVIGAKVTKIPAYIFKYTYVDSGWTEWAEDSSRAGVTEVIFEEGSVCTSYGAHAFEDCRSLETITIPASVKSIGESAFYDCESLTEITFEGNAPSIGTNAFYGVTADASHPVNDKTWTDSVKQSYGGFITWNGVFSAPTGTCGTDLIWVLDDQGTLTISGTGAMQDWTSSGNVPWYNYRRSIKKVVINSGVTSIGTYAFYDCDGLTSVTIPDSVTAIGSSAFSSCTGLTSVTIGNSVTTIGNYAFYNCTKLTSVTIGNSVTTIGNYAFYNCTGLTSVTIGNSVTTIGNYAFEDCTGLTSVTIGNSVTTIGNYAFYNCTGLTSVTIPDSVTTIGSHAFYNCTGLKSVTIGTGVTTIGWEAFCYCTGLKEVYFNAINCADGDYYANVFACAGSTGMKVVIGKQVTKIPANIFKYTYEEEEYWPWAEDSNRYGVTEIVFEEGSVCTSIGANAFKSCRCLEEITIPASVKSIGGTAFSDCESLTEITFVGNAPSIGTNAFYGITAEAFYPDCNETWTESVKKNYGGLITWAVFVDRNLEWTVNDDGQVTITGVKDRTITELVIPVTIEGKAVTHIGPGAFSGCTKLAKITLPHTLISSGKGAFEDCTALKEVHISDIKAWCGITFDGRNSNPVYKSRKLYVNGTLLTDLVIPEGTKSIGDYAFYGCKDIKTLSLPDSLEQIGLASFISCSGLTSVTIPENVKTIGLDAFMGATYLTEIIYNAKNAADLPAVNYVFGNVGTKGSGVTVTIGANVEKVPANLFYPSDSTPVNLKTVVFEGVDIEVGEAAFYGCTTITDVHYAGTLYQWERLAIGTRNDPLTTATIHTEAPMVKSIIVEKLPNKTTYVVGEALDTTGLTLKLCYHDGDSKTVTSGFSVSVFDSSTEGTKTVTVTYEGKTTTFTVTVVKPEVDENKPQITVSNEKGMPGETVTVTVTIENNPGILNALLTLEFDAGVELIKVERGDALGNLNMTTSGVLQSGCKFLWDAVDTADLTDGIMLTLTFRIPEDAQDGTAYAIKFSYVDGDIADNDLDPVDVELVSGKIEVQAFLFGDVNNDGRINGTDVTMIRRYITGGYNVEILTQAADVNHDGRINGTDVTLIRRYITGGYGVELNP